MRRWTLLVFTILGCAAPAAADPAPIAYNLHYQAVSLGFTIVQMDVSVRIFPRTYAVALSYHTTGLARFFHPGRESDKVIGVWEGDRAAPERYLASGEWHGRPRRLDIAYHEGQPEILELSPPNTDERQPVPPALQRGTEDTLSALAQLLRTVERSGSCNTAARIFDGRRLSEIDASTVGVESLRRSPGAIFAGTALRCDFVGRMLAGFLLDRPHTTPGRARHGSAWFASLQPGGPALPVRMQFGTDWFGEVTIVLTGATPQAPGVVEAVSSSR
jgi:hypothetical protein